MRIVINLKTITNGLATLFSLSVFLSLGFVFWGDKILPKPLGKISHNTRITLQAKIGKFITEEQQEFGRLKGGDKEKRSKLRLKPNHYFERAVEEAKKQTNSN